MCIYKFKNDLAKFQSVLRNGVPLENSWKIFSGFQVGKWSHQEIPCLPGTRAGDTEGSGAFDTRNPVISPQGIYSRPLSSSKPIPLPPLTLNSRRRQIWTRKPQAERKGLDLFLFRAYFSVYFSVSLVLEE